MGYTRYVGSVKSPFRENAEGGKKALTSNRDLRDFLVEMSGRLVARGLPQLGNILVGPLSCYGTGTSEFIYECQSAVWQVLKAKPDQLTPEECADLVDVHQQINDAVDRRS
jgi:hypothetical protein